MTFTHMMDGKIPIKIDEDNVELARLYLGTMPRIDLLRQFLAIGLTSAQAVCTLHLAEQTNAEHRR